MYKGLIFTVLITSFLTACKDGSTETGKNENPPPQPPPQTTCSEQGIYACKSGETEPLYPFQWILNYKKSFF